MINAKVKLTMLLFCIFISCNADAKEITSFDISAATIKAALNHPTKNCLRYRFPPTRFCHWFTEPNEYNTTPVIDHYLPDLVVVVFRNKNPWTEASVLDIPFVKLREKIISNAGGGNHSFSNNREQNVVFKEADVIGNPALIGFSIPGVPVLLNSTATPMQPYFQSIEDSMLWRGFPPAVAEETASIVLGAEHHIGTGLITNWGGVYPHEGKVLALDDAKGSMVIAQRAADLTTSSVENSFGHLHGSLSNICGEHCKASPVVENNNDTLFQLIYPITSEQDECHVLGEDAYTSDMLNDDGEYVWIVWRHYKGCAEGGTIYLGEYP